MESRKESKLRKKKILASTERKREGVGQAEEKAELFNGLRNHSLVLEKLT